ncbi:MAG: class I SAM-dependent RNA methyltransferase [Candidatus Contendobacter sp.]|nr:class I SAM-dependent RNA methyltransferase [Candidatus Contendobacter sp.]
MTASSLNLPAGCEPRCPGCTHRMLDATASEAQKMDWLRRTLAPWADRLSPMRTVAGAARWGYRGKVCLSAVWSEAEGWNFGLWRRDELIPIPDCPIHTGLVRAMVRWLRGALPPGTLFPLAFYVQAGAQATLILKAPRVPNLDWLDGERQAELADIGLEGFWLHLHPAAGRRLFARNGWTLLWGQPRSRDAFGLEYGPTAFQQLIPALYREALDAAETFLAPESGDSLADLYCGIGASLARWTRRGARTLGVELGGEAVACAGLNAPTATVLRGKCADRIPQLRAWTPTKGTRLLYLNPPRTGLEPAVLTWTTDEYRPERLAYLSCSAGTLSRDLRELTEAGYTMERLIPYDFFPQTRHVETLALLGCGAYGYRATESDRADCGHSLR